MERDSTLTMGFNTPLLCGGDFLLKISMKAKLGGSFLNPQKVDMFPDMLYQGFGI
jgi:hypothetical protein